MNNEENHAASGNSTGDLSVIPANTQDTPVKPRYITQLSNSGFHPVGKEIGQIDGEYQAEANVSVAQWTAQTLRVDTPEALAAVLKSQKHYQALILDFIPGTEDGAEFILASKDKYSRLQSSGSKKPLYQLKKDNFVPGGWILLDWDHDPNLPANLVFENHDDWFAYLAKIIPALNDAPRVVIPSSKSRVVDANGDRVFSTPSAHTYVMADIQDMDQFRNCMEIRLWAGDAGYIKSNEHGAAMRRTILDTSVLAISRRVFESEPKLHKTAKGLAIQPAQVTVITPSSGQPLTPDHVRTTDADIDKFQQLTGGAVSVTGTGQVKPAPIVFEDLTWETVIETENYGQLTLREIVEKFPGEKIRCQTPFRPSESWAGYINYDATRLPFLYDVGAGKHVLTPEARVRWAGEEFAALVEAVEAVEAAEAAKVEQAEAEAGAGAASPAEKWMLENIITLKRGGFYCLDEHCIVPSATTLDGCYGHLQLRSGGAKPRRLKPSEFLAQSPDKQVVYGPGWLPGGSKIIKLDGRSYVNTYLPISIEPVAGNVDQWLELVRHIYGAHADLVLDHMAFTVQRPEEKIRWAVIVIGKQRTGKSLVLRPLVKLFGSAGLSITPDNTDTNWGDVYFQKKVLAYEELYRPGDRTFMNKLKLRVSNDDIELLNLKGKGQVAQKNVASIYGFTNEHDAMHLTERELEKFLIVEGPGKIYTDEGKAEQFYKQLGAKIDKGNMVGRVYRYLLDRSVDNFSYHRMPVAATEMFNQVTASSKPSWVQIFEEKLEQGRVVAELGQIASPGGMLDYLKRINPRISFNGMTAGLREIGLRRVPEAGRMSIRIDGAPRKLSAYVLDEDHVEKNNMTEVDIVRATMPGQAGQIPHYGATNSNVHALTPPKPGKK